MRTGERGVAVAFSVSTLAALGLVVVYAAGGEPRLEGSLLAVALGGIGVGLALFAKRFLPNDEVTEERGGIASPEAEVAGFTESFEAGEEAIGRRPLLARLGLAAFAALGLAALFPLRSLGPQAGKGLRSTAFANGGLRLVDEGGEPLRAGDVTAGGLLTVFPEGHQDEADAPTLLVRPASGDFRLDEERSAWVVDGVVAYSKLCTHLGCPVGLYQAPENLLLCPCHQSTFDVLDGARPVFGPATRPLPQLPLGVDEDGFLVALGDFTEPVGGGFWDRGRS